MDIIISFFRDVLNGPIYIAVVIVNSILICSCIGYLAERSMKIKAERVQSNVGKPNVNNTLQNSTYGIVNVQGQSETLNTANVQTNPNVVYTNYAQSNVQSNSIANANSNNISQVNNQ